MKNILFLITLLLAPLPAMAADAQALASEIIYRANLGRADDVELLLKKGVSANQADENGVPILALASARKDAEGMRVVKLLLEKGADINAADKKGQTALFYAAKQGNAEVVSHLLNHGINYYASDERGDIARNLAHNAGYSDIVEMMDKFVVEQSEKVQQQYRDYNETVKKQHETIAQEAANMESEQAVEAVAKTAEEIAAAAEIKAQRASPEFDQAMHNLAFHNCAFQYWSFCRQVKQTTDLTSEELNVAIDSHKDEVVALNRSAMASYKLPKTYVDQVSNHAKQRIINRLEAMPSNTYRFEQGVCRMADMKPRCEEIAGSWSQEPEPVVNRPSSGGGGGVMFYNSENPSTTSNYGTGRQGDKAATGKAGRETRTGRTPRQRPERQQRQPAF